MSHSEGSNVRIVAFRADSGVTTEPTPMAVQSLIMTSAF